MTRVVLVDDHPLWRDALERDLVAADCTVVGTAAEVRQAIDVIRATRPDVVVLDLQLADGSGVDVVRALGEDGPAVLVLSASGESDDVLAAVQAGALGYLLKSATSAELCAAVAATARGEAVFTPGLAGLVLGEYRRIARGESGPTLSDREVEVLKLVSQGLSSRQIAERLVISHRTVQNHTQSTLRKLQLHNRVELARYAIEHGLSEPD